MIDYDKLYVEILQYLGEEFDFNMGEASIHSEQLTEIVKENIEEELSNYEEEQYAK